MEIIIAVVILGIIASLAIPNYAINVEKGKSAEGAQILEALLNAQRRYYLEYNDFEQGTDINQLDLDIELGPGTQNFKAPAVWKKKAQLASIERINGQYILFIDANGVIYCDEEGAPEGTCLKLGYTQGDFQK